MWQQRKLILKLILKKSLVGRPGIARNILCSSRYIMIPPIFRLFIILFSVYSRRLKILLTKCPLIIVLPIFIKAQSLGKNGIAGFKNSSNTYMQTGLYSHRKWLEVKISDLGRRGCVSLYRKTRAADLLFKNRFSPLIYPSKDLYLR